ncbi:unnamed protein product [Diamesa hyperborea]
MSNKLRVCRVCLEPDGKVKLAPIFAHSDKNKIALKIFILSGIQIVEKDSEIPTLICLNCSLDLSRAVRTKQLCIKADQYFKNLISRQSKTYSTGTNEEETSLIPNIKTEQFEINNSEENFFEPFNYSEHCITELKPVKKTYVKNIYSRVSSKLLTKQNNEKSTGQRRSKIMSQHFDLKLSDYYSCDLCEKKFKVRYSMIVHFKRIHLNLKCKESHICLICGKTLQTSYSLKMHELQHQTSIPKFHCDLCGKKFQQKNYLYSHMKNIHTETNKFVCTYCGKGYPKKYSLIEHVRDHTGELPFPCTMCDKKFSKKKNLVIHTRVHTTLLCKLCNKYFTTPGSLKSHEKVTHHMLLDADLFSCDICHRVFKLKYYLSRHIRVVHLKLNMPKKKYNCELCDKSYVKNTYLKLHIDSKHHHIRPYKCDHPGCVKTFDAKQKLAIHNRIHTGEKPHVCPFCDKRFIHQTDHKRHVMGHTGERPHKCNACGKGFIKRSELTAHDGRCHSTVAQPLQTFQYP